MSGDCVHAASFASAPNYLPKHHRSQSLDHPLASQQSCSICQRSLQALFARNICSDCRLPVCAAHIREKQLALGWECERCMRSRVKEKQDLQLDRILEVLKLRLFGLERERDHWTCETACEEHKLAQLSQIKPQSEDLVHLEASISPAALQTAQLVEQLATCKGQYTALVQQNTLLENQLVHFLQQEEALKAAIASKEHSNKSLSHKVIDQMRTLDQRVPLRKLKPGLCEHCYTQIKPKYLGDRPSRRRKASPQSKRCLFC